MNMFWISALTYGQTYKWNITKLKNLIYLDGMANVECSMGEGEREREGGKRQESHDKMLKC